MLRPETVLLAKTRLTGARPAPVRARSGDDLFRTAKHKLKRNGLTLRVRRAGDDYVQTVKAEMSGALARGEWEAKLDGATPDLRKPRRRRSERLITEEVAAKAEACLFRTSVRRMALPIRTRRSELELAG